SGAAPAQGDLRDRDPKPGGADRHRHRPRRHPLLPPRCHHRRRGATGRRDHRAARRPLRGGAARGHPRHRGPTGPPAQRDADGAEEDQFPRRARGADVTRAGGAALALALVLAACAPAPAALHNGPARPVPADGSIRIVATPLPLNPKNPAQDRIGDFVFAGAVQLTSPDTTLLGGLSDLKVAADGSLVAETDEGALVRAQIVLDDKGRLIGLDHARISLLKGLNGQPLPGKAEADAEGVAAWPNGDLMISFERDDRIWVYPADGGAPRPAPKP